MGIYDRDYSQEKFRNRYSSGPPMRFRFAPLTPMVKRLLTINIAIFFAGLLIKPLGIFLYKWFAINAGTLSTAIQPWRLITYQFLHDPDDLLHIIFNMLGLFFLGPTLERNWGSRKFLIFYLSCGAAGGLFYLLLVAVNVLPGLPMVGASGAILGMLAACAILFPQFVVFFFLFPLPIRLAAIIFTLLYIANILMGGPNAGGDAAHLAGMAAGAVYVWYKPWREKIKLKTATGQWQRKVAKHRNLQAEVDRILDKVQKQGITSLTRKERDILEEATRQEQMRNKP